MAQINDIIRVVASGTYQEQNVVNVFFYKIGAGSSGALLPEAWLPDWSVLFQSQVLFPLSAGLNYNRLVYDNLTDGVEFADVTINQSGQSGGDPMPSSVAMGVKMARTTKVTRNGAKRYAGLTETVVSGNVLTLGGIDKDNIEAFHGTLLSIPDYDGAGSNLELLNVIVGRTLDGQGNYVLDITKVNLVADAEVKANVTTQNTRKP